MTQNFEPPVVVKTIRLFELSRKLILGFPKTERYSLGIRILDNLLGILELVFEANNMPIPLREVPLVKAKAKIELVKILVRLAYEAKLLTTHRYFEQAGLAEEIGKMLYGWIAYQRSLRIKK